MSNDSQATWQKVTLIITLLVFALPIAGPFVWHIVFPQNYLLYEVGPTTKAETLSVASVLVTNAGHEVQKDVVLYLPNNDFDPTQTLIEIAPPRSLGLQKIYDAEPKTPATSFAAGTGFKLPLGSIPPEEQVRVTVLSKTRGYSLSARLSATSIRVESASTSAIEADGVRYPDYNNDPHTTYRAAAPYILAMLVALIGLLILSSALFALLFDSPQKQMTRLWRQMDQLQEQIDKERRYK